MPQKIVLFIHGHMGSVRQFDTLVKAINCSEADVRCLVLPGHECGVDDFVKSNHFEWQHSVDVALDELRPLYKEIYIIGHSMGGLLAILTAVHNPNGIFGIVALALPLRLKLTREGLRVRLGALRPPLESDDANITAARHLCGIHDVTARDTLRLIPNSIGLLHLMHGTERAMGRLSVPLVVINSSSDEIVSVRSSGIVTARLPFSRLITLEKSTHFLYDEAEAAAVAATVNALLSDAVQ
ncbi:MAG: alpha/beta fold hydrolase [Oscillospiraceae bacterium]